MKRDRHDETGDLGALVDAVVFARRRGISVERLDQLVAERRLFAVERDGKKLYPAFFVHQAIEIRRLEAVCKRLGSLSGGSKWQFFVAPKASLAGRTPLEALRDGHLQAVQVAADGFRER